MAIYHLHGQVIGRADGRSVVNAAAYRAGEALYDRRLGKQFDYTRKSGVEESVILGPAHAATWMFDRELLWNAVEQAERRTNSQLAREFDVAIPVELARQNPTAAKELVRRWATEMFVSQGLMVDISFHDMKSRNPHAHVLASMRRVHAQAAEFETGSRHAFEPHKARHLDDRGYLDFWRECWADFANESLAAEGFDARIDHRSLIDQGIVDREPGIHIGPSANAMFARGLETDRWTKNAIIWFQNEEPYWEQNRAYLEWAEAEERRREQVSTEAAVEPIAKRENPEPKQSGPITPVSAEGLCEVPQSQCLQDAIAWFVAEEDYWRANREMLPWLEEQERELLRREAADAEKREEAKKEVDAARAIAAQAGQLEELGQQLIRAVVTTMRSKKAEVAGMTSRLQENVPDVMREREQLATLTSRLRAAGPQISAMEERLTSAGDRLSAAIHGSIADRSNRLTATDERLEWTKINLLKTAGTQLAAAGRRGAEGMAEGLRGLIDKGRAGVSKLIRGGTDLFVPAHRTTSEMPGSVDLARENGSSIPEDRAEVEVEYEAPASLSPTELQNRRWREAVELLMYLESERSRAKVSRTPQGWVLVPSSLPSKYQELLGRVGDHAIIKDYVEARRQGILSAWGKLLNGDVPVVGREQGRFVVIDAAVPEWLREHAQDLLDRDAGFQGLARRALIEWSRGKSPSSASAPRTATVNQTAQTSQARVGQPKPTISQPDWYEQLVERRAKGGPEVDI